MNQTNTKARQELAAAIEEAQAYMKACADGSEAFSAFHPSLNGVEDAIRLTKFQTNGPAGYSIGMDLSNAQAA